MRARGHLVRALSCQRAFDEGTWAFGESTCTPPQAFGERTFAPLQA